MQISEEITVKVSSKAAQAYQQATEREKEYLNTLVSLFLEQEMKEEVGSLGTLMDEISERAASRGLTPEILESILNE
mgnify:CR=1 FL=1